MVKLNDEISSNSPFVYMRKMNLKRGSSLEERFVRMTDRIEKQDLGLYVHLPFCVKKCRYCDFLSAPATKEMQKKYCEALLKEIESYGFAAEQYKIRTIYFGGGTPSLLEEEWIGRILEKICHTFSDIDKKQIEITLEVNPGTVNRAKWKAYEQMGINRISIGLQSSHDEELKLLGRVHFYSDFLQCYEDARAQYFSNISVDIMSALPGQTIDTYRKTLERVVELKPEHISSYSLIVEPETEFWQEYGPGMPKENVLPDEDTDRKMYILTKEILKASGYDRYEISNYAIPGFESKHNSSYWTGVSYIGLGLGASSYFQGKRYCNCSHMEQYLQCASQKEKRVEQVEVIGRKEEMEEFMFLGLRMTKGIENAKFLQRFQEDIYTVYGSVIERLKKKNLLQENGTNIWLTDYGIDVSNSVLSEFLLD